MLSTWLCASAYGVGARSFDTKLKPNIISKIQNVFVGGATINDTIGAFTATMTTPDRMSTRTGDSGYATLDFDPSLVSAEYVTGGSVRQASLRVLACVKF